LHAELAVDYFELRSADVQEQLLDDTVKAYTDALKLTQSRFDGGAAPKADVAQAKTQLDGARVQDTDVTVMRAQYEHAIATLIGKPPAEFSITPSPKTALQLPSVPSAGPISLLGNGASQKQTIRSALLAWHFFHPSCLAPLPDLQGPRSRIGSTGPVDSGLSDPRCRRPYLMLAATTLSLKAQPQTMTAP
jgi:hypothetical protein